MSDPGSEHLKIVPLAGVRRVVLHIDSGFAAGKASGMQLHFTISNKPFVRPGEFGPTGYSVFFPTVTITVPLDAHDTVPYPRTGRSSRVIDIVDHLGEQTVAGDHPVLKRYMMVWHADMDYYLNLTIRHTGRGVWRARRVIAEVQYNDVDCTYADAGAAGIVTRYDYHVARGPGARRIFHADRVRIGGAGDGASVQLVAVKGSPHEQQERSVVDEPGKSPDNVNYAWKGPWQKG